MRAAPRMPIRSGAAPFPDTNATLALAPARSVTREVGDDSPTTSRSCAGRIVSVGRVGTSISGSAARPTTSTPALSPAPTFISCVAATNTPPRPWCAAFWPPTTGHAPCTPKPNEHPASSSPTSWRSCSSATINAAPPAAKPGANTSPPTAHAKPQRWICQHVAQRRRRVGQAAPQRSVALSGRAQDVWFVARRMASTSRPPPGARVRSRICSVVLPSIPRESAVR